MQKRYYTLLEIDIEITWEPAQSSDFPEKLLRSTEPE
jgi:hypothetical protein